MTIWPDGHRLRWQQQHLNLLVC